MAGYRLAPVAARLRRRPRVRARGFLPSKYAPEQTIGIGTATEVDVAPTFGGSDQTVTVGPALETDSAQLIVPSTLTTTGAQGGLAWLFSGGEPLDQTITVGPATEVDTARPVGAGATQTVTVHPATETDTAQPVLVDGVESPGTWNPRLSSHPYSSGSRWNAVASAPTRIIEGLPRAAGSSSLAIDTSGAVWSHHHGVPLTAEGAIAATIDGTTPTSLTGVPITAAGRLACTQVDPDQLRNGVPIITNGCVCLLVG